MSVKNFTKKLLVVLLLLALYSRFGPSIPFSIVSQDKGQPLVVEGVGKVATKPDIAKVSAGVVEEGEVLEEVEESVSGKTKTLVKSIQDLGVKEEDIKTSSYNIYPQYSYEQEIRQIIGYRAQVNYEIEVEDVEIVNQILTTLTENGANVVGGVIFEVSDEAREKLLDEARKSAAKEAREKAESLARATGVKLGRVLSITEYEDGSSYPTPFLERGDGTQTLDSSLPEIPSGESEIAITISMSFEIR